MPLMGEHVGSPLQNHNIMKTLFITALVFCTMFLFTQNTTAQNTATQAQPAQEENVSPFVAMTFADLPDEVQRKIRRTLYLQGYRSQTQTIYQHRETREIKVEAISNEASMVTFFFDQYGNYKRS